MILRERIRNVLGGATPASGRFYGPSCAAVGAIAASLVWLAYAGGKQEAHTVIETPPTRFTATQPPDELSPPDDHMEFLVAALHDEKPVLVVDAPNASHMVPLPPYVIEAPDVLAIDVAVTSEAGATITSAGPVQGQYLVGPDGAIELPSYGRVQVAGLTIDKARAAIGRHIQQCAVRAVVEEKMKERSHAPDVSIDVAAYNSKFYYVVTECRGHSMIQRIPITGQETVMDGLSHVDAEEFGGNSNKEIWVARPATADGCCAAQMLPVDLRAIVEKHDAHSNWQLFPGDRIFIMDPSPFDPSSGKFVEAVAVAAAGTVLELAAESLENVAILLRAGAQVDWLEEPMADDESDGASETHKKPDSANAESNVGSDVRLNAIEAPL